MPKTAYTCVYRERLKRVLCQEPDQAKNKENDSIQKLVGGLETFCGQTQEEKSKRRKEGCQSYGEFLLREVERSWFGAAYRNGGVTVLNYIVIIINARTVCTRRKRLSMGILWFDRKVNNSAKRVESVREEKETSRRTSRSLPTRSRTSLV